MQNDFYVQLSDAEHRHLLKSDLESKLTKEWKSTYSSAIKQNLFDGFMEEGAKIDSFSQWLSKEVDEESNMQSSSDSYWETVKRENWVHDSSEISFSQWVSKEVGVKESNMESSSYGYCKTVKRENWIDDSSNSAEAHLNPCLLGPSLTQNQLYSIIDFSPNWAFVGSEIKVNFSLLFHFFGDNIS